MILIAQQVTETLGGASRPGRVPVCNATGHLVTSWLNPTPILIGVVGVVGWVIAQDPYVLPPELTLREAAAPDATLTALMFGCLAAGLVLMIGFEAAITRVLGVVALFAFIVLGVFLIADPELLDSDDL
jgi:hypothetical protein